MIKGIGVDLVEIDRIQLKDHFIDRVLSDKEIEVYKTLSSDCRKKEFIAGRFAGKEALVKALNDKTISFKSISILNEIDGRPSINYKNTFISISHERDYAVAYVIVEK